MPNTHSARHILAAAGTGSTASDVSSDTGTATGISQKKPGETLVLAIMGGDLGHNAVPLEYEIRSLFASKRNWRIVFVQSSRFFTPELIHEADLLITSRHFRPDDIDFRTNGLVESMTTGISPWRDDTVGAIVDSVTRRGMGFLALHNSLSCGRKEITSLLGAEPLPHKQIQPLWLHDLNGEHPISRGIEHHMLPLDEQFAAVIDDPDAVSLFSTTAMHDKREAIGGWCIERGNGRTVTFLPGHMRTTYRTRPYREMLWRAAHWAMKRDIPAY